MSLTPSEIEHQLLQAHALAAKAGQLPAFGGLTKRELFAAMAMQGFITGCYAGNNAGFTVEGNISAAVDYADALIKALETPTGEKK